jgi:hypothetical protein
MAAPTKFKGFKKGKKEFPKSDNKNNDKNNIDTGPSANFKKKFGRFK